MPTTDERLIDYQRRALSLAEALTATARENRNQVARALEIIRHVPAVLTLNKQLVELAGDIRRERDAARHMSCSGCMWWLAAVVIGGGLLAYAYVTYAGATP